MPGLYEALRPKFQLNTADWALYMGTQTWKMNGNRPRFQPALMSHMINGQDPYLMRKVVEEPKP